MPPLLTTAAVPPLLPQGRMLARAGSKLALEKLVIKRGAFVDVKAEEEEQGMGAQELLELLKPKEVAGDDPQSGVVDNKVRRARPCRSHTLQGHHGSSPGSSPQMVCGT